ncbi:tyrosine-type recombinase/integrase [Chryseobacterium sp. APV1]|uniref:Tyrosine-type recombinase/integrase n=1 Tax=Chryseobacterium urinae TaxID=3058400 RepID=A0ABT8U2B3_9FLAO|nr:tyrosine-type recombinase/integrase [Chryseobacterium sp. APV1]MDO3425191.1 tyrosine-type recombinase/integrase [Chryseobacterium sp. APV1]
MFNRIFKDPCTIKIHEEAPLYKERVDYLKPLLDKGYTVKSLQTIENLLLKIVQYLNLQTGQPITIHDINKAADLYSHNKKNHTRIGFISTATIWLKKLNLLELAQEEQIPIFNMLLKNRSWLLQQTMKPLLKERAAYLQLQVDGGAKKKTLRVIAEYLVVIMEYLNFNSPRLVTTKEIIQAANQWAGRKTYHFRKSNFSIEAKNRFIGVSVKWFKYIGCLMIPKKEHFPFFRHELTEYVKYMRDEKGLSEWTVDGQCRKLTYFLKDIFFKCKSLSDISHQIIDRMVMKLLSRKSRITVKDSVGAFRVFLRFAESKCWCRKGLADSIKIPRVYKQSSLPYPPQWKDIQRLIASCNKETAIDIRDRAIIMLFVIYGLRRSEVTELLLDDIDWENDRIYIRRSKHSKPQIFPLSPNAGSAIIHYLQKVRPNNISLKEIFLTTLAPYRKLSVHTVYKIVEKRLRPMQLGIAHHGPHALRHGCATHLINNGICLNEVRDHLGQLSMDAARIYAKVDLISLRKISEFNLKGLL